MDAPAQSTHTTTTSTLSTRITPTAGTRTTGSYSANEDTTSGVSTTSGTETSRLLCSEETTVTTTGTRSAETPTGSTNSARGEDTTSGISTATPSGISHLLRLEEAERLPANKSPNVVIHQVATLESITGNSLSFVTPTRDTAGAAAAAGTGAPTASAYQGTSSSAAGASWGTGSGNAYTSPTNLVGAVEEYVGQRVQGKDRNGKLIIGRVKSVDDSAGENRFKCMIEWYRKGFADEQWDEEKVKTGMRKNVQDKDEEGMSYVGKKVCVEKSKNVFFLGTVVAFGTNSGCWHVSFVDPTEEKKWLTKKDLLDARGVYDDDPMHWEDEENEDTTVATENEEEPGSQERDTRKRRVEGSGEEPHRCDVVQFYQEENVGYKKCKNKKDMIVGGECGDCGASMMEYTRTKPLCVCPKFWFSWELDGPRGYTGRSGECNKPFLCFGCYIKCLGNADKEDQASGRGTRRKRRKA